MDRDTAGSATGAAASGTAGRVLVVEASPLTRRLVRGMVADLGYTADAVGSGDEALQALGAARYDVVLLDAHLPAMGDVKTAARIRILQGDDARTPIVAMSEHLTPEERARCLAASMNAVLAKPVAPRELAEVLAACTSPRSRLERAVAAAGVALDREAAGSAGPATASFQVPPGLPVLDLAAIEAFRGMAPAGMPDPTPRLVALFRRESRVRLEALRAAAERGDAHAVYQAAHAAKGSAGTFGARQMHALAEEIERRGRAGTVADLQPLVAALAEAFERVDAALTAAGLPGEG